MMKVGYNTAPRYFLQRQGNLIRAFKIATVAKLGVIDKISKKVLGSLTLGNTAHLHIPEAVIGK